MSQTFVIRGYYWNYNGEIYYPCGSYIKSVFNNEEEAQKIVVSLERKHWKEVDLWETSAFFDADDGFIEKANRFVLKKCGELLFTSHDRRDTFIPNSLGDKDYMQFLKMADLQAYKLTQFDGEPKFYALWFPENEGYFMLHGEHSSALIYSESIAALKEEAAEELACQWGNEKIKIKGELNSLSDSPSALESLIENTKEFKFDREEVTLSVNSKKIDAFFSANELLKKSLFEIKKLSLNEVKKIESEMGSVCGL